MYVHVEITTKPLADNKNPMLLFKKDTLKDSYEFQSSKIPMKNIQIKEVLAICF
jgi:hypothetical protein